MLFVRTEIRSALPARAAIFGSNSCIFSPMDESDVTDLTMKNVFLVFQLWKEIKEPFSAHLDSCFLHLHSPAMSHVPVFVHHLACGVSTTRLHTNANEHICVRTSFTLAQGLLFSVVVPPHTQTRSHELQTSHKDLLFHNVNAPPTFNIL